jgi:hypothetical protein
LVFRWRRRRKIGATFLHVEKWPIPIFRSRSVPFYADELLEEPVDFGERGYSKKDE